MGRRDEEADERMMAMEEVDATEDVAIPREGVFGALTPEWTIDPTPPPPLLSSGTTRMLLLPATFLTSPTSDSPIPLTPTAATLNFLMALPQNPPASEPSLTTGTLRIDLMGRLEGRIGRTGMGGSASPG